jgi:hypothetical protein
MTIWFSIIHQVAEKKIIHQVSEEKVIHQVSEEKSNSAVRCGLSLPCCYRGQ